MPSTVASSAVPTQPKDLRERSPEVRARLAGIRAKDARVRIDPNQKEVLGCIRRAMSTRGLSQKAFAITARCTESELSDALNGRDNRRFDVEWVWRQDDDFVIAFLDEVTAARGLTPENKSAVRRRRIIELIDLLLQEMA